jgi:hypothetical protein
VRSSQKLLASATGNSILAVAQSQKNNGTKHPTQVNKLTLQLIFMMNPYLKAALSESLSILLNTRELNTRDAQQ